MLESVKSWWANAKEVIRANACRTTAAFVVSFCVIGLVAAPPVAADQVLNPDPNAAALGAPPVFLGPEEQQILLDEIESYFNTVDTLQSRFLQFNSDGTIYQGDLLIKRPGMMRIDYDDPIPFLIVADGTFYIFVDEELEQASHIPLNLTPAEILLRQPLALSNDLEVTDAARADGRLLITVAHTEEEDLGSLTFVFDENPLELLQWIVVDTQGLITRVVLQDPILGAELDRDLFRFINPWTVRDDTN